MADSDRIAFDAMNNAVSESENNPGLDWDKKLKELGFDENDFHNLYVTKYADEKEMPRSNLATQEKRYQEMKQYWDPDTYRILDDKAKAERLVKGESILGDLMEFSEKKRFNKLTGFDADQFEWDQDMKEIITRDNIEYSESPFRRKHGFEDWMRDKGYYDETKTGGIKAAIQRILPGGKEGMSRRFADPKESRRIHREVMDNMFKEDSERKDIGEFQKTGNY